MKHLTAMKHIHLARITLLSAALLFTLAGCETMKGMEIGGVKLAPLVNAGEKLAKTGPTSEQEESQLGRHMAGTLVGIKRLDNNSQEQRYVNRVGRWLSLHSSRPALQWRFGVLDDQDVNAFAAPGGYVFVTRGLLDMLDNEAELAGVLAHEIAHVTYQHHLKAVRSNNLMGAAMDMGMFLGDAATGGNAGNTERAFAERAVNASRTLYARGLDKGDEYQADAEALRLMMLSGYDPYAFVAVMQKLDARSAKDSGMALLLQTHPSPANRLTAISQVMATLPLTGPQATLPERFRQEVR
jgi:predicted Zn-dependent protease